VRSLKSVEKNGSPYSDPMDEIMYGKLLAQANQRITYTLTSLTLKEQPREMTESYQYEATGNLTVAGVTNVITMPVTVLPDAAGRIQFASSVKVKMTDFKISPPSPSFGGVSITTGDEVTLKFNWWVNRVSTGQAAK
jgi:polyisoprenoid-binding protein YceI